MDMRLIELKETVLFGLTKPYENQGYKHPEELRNTMWSAKYEGVPNKICLKEWKLPMPMMWWICMTTPAL